MCVIAGIMLFVVHLITARQGYVLFFNWSHAYNYSVCIIWVCTMSLYFDRKPWPVTRASMCGFESCTSASL